MRGERLSYRLYEWFDNSLNPIVVKELLQIVRSQYLSIGLTLFLAFQVLGAGVSSNNTGNPLFGAEYFIDIITVILLLGALAVAIYAGHRFSKEHSGLDADLLFITTLTPQSIIRGKFLAAFAIITLFYCAALPYMTFAYFLPGVDLFSVLAIVALCFLFAIINISIFLFLACAPLPQALSTGAKVCAIFISLWFLGISQNICHDIQIRGVTSFLDSFDVLHVAMPSMLFLAFSLGMLYNLSVAALSPANSNRAYAPRLFTSICWLLSLINVILCFDPTKAKTCIYGFLLWNMIITLLMCIGILIAVHERSGYSRRITCTIPQSFPKRIAAFLLSSGAAGGVAWSVLLFILTQVMVSCALMIAPYPPNDAVLLIEAIPSWGYYIGGYILLSAWLRRKFFSTLIPVKYTWALALALIVIGSVLHSILGPLILGEEFEEWCMGNPLIFYFGGSFRMADWNMFTKEATSMFAGLMLILNLPWLKQQWEQFKPFNEKAQIVGKHT